MCRALYIASDTQLPLIEWVEAAPAFSVSELQEHEEVVRKHFTLANVVHAGSFESCSCGFVYEDEPIEDNEFEKQYDQQARESVKKLGEYVSNALNHGLVEMYACWESEFDSEPEEHLVIGLDFFNQKDFNFENGRHYTARGNA